MSGRLLCAAGLTAAALLAAGCGSNGGGSSGTTPVGTWAGGLCTAITTWTSSISTAATTLEAGGLSQQSLRNALDSVKKATATFASSLDGLGRPSTAVGQKAKASVDRLATEIQADLEQVEAAIAAASGVLGYLSAVPVVTGTLQTARSQVSSTIADLRSLDLQGELQRALKQAKSCGALTGGG